MTIVTALLILLGGNPHHHAEHTYWHRAPALVSCRIGHGCHVIIPDTLHDH